MNDDTMALVVGAGPSGLMMAGELARLAVPCRLIDRAPQPTPYSQALGVQARTLEYLERIGRADQAVAAGLRAHGVNFYSDGRRIVHLTFDQIESRYNYVLVLPQSDTERLLGEQLTRLGLTVERPVELLHLSQDAGGVEATLRQTDRGAEERLRVSWLIGCDGAHSTVRHLLGIPFEGQAFPESIALADVRVEANVPDDELSIYLTGGGLVGFIPMRGDHRYRMILERQHDSTTQSEPQLADFQHALDRWGPRGGGRVSDPVWMSRFHISQRRVASYRHGRVFLAGDAAHIHSPLGAQGMNTGMQDACNLAWKLALVASGRGSPDLLESYQQERQPLGKALLRTTGTLSQIVFWRHPIPEAVRDRLTAFLTSFDWVQDRMRAALSETAVHYRQSPLVREYHSPGLVPQWFNAGRGPHAGDRAPDGTARRSDGAPVRLFELMPGLRHTLLLFAGRRSGAVAARRRREVLEVVADGFTDLIDTYVILPAATEPGEAAGHAAMLLDDDGSLHHAYGADDGALFVIRPDGYVGLRSRPPAAAPLRNFLRSYLVPAAHAQAVPA
jgi:2-polyprenyl-6-methoxyphenol hydroxylase-like FAD-dependent oxidoreductase